MLILIPTFNEYVIHHQTKFSGANWNISQSSWFPWTNSNWKTCGGRYVKLFVFGWSCSQSVKRTIDQSNQSLPTFFVHTHTHTHTQLSKPYLIWSFQSWLQLISIWVKACYQWQELWVWVFDCFGVCVDWYAWKSDHNNRIAGFCDELGWRKGSTSETCW